MTSKDNQACEYALGTLSSEERNQVTRLMKGDSELARMVGDWEQRLAPLGACVEPEEPRSQVWQAIKKRMGPRNTALPRGIEAVYSTDGIWRPIYDKVKIKSLFIDHETGAESFLLRFEAGGVIERHDHGSWNDECIILEGDLTVGNVEFGQGDFHVAKQGSVHPRLFSIKGCTVFVRSRQVTEVTV